MKPTYEELEAKCALQQSKLEAINKLMGVVETASDIAKAGVAELEARCAALGAENAGLKAREVILPVTIEAHPFGPQLTKMLLELHRNTVNECANAIRAAGIKIKGE